MCYRAGAWHVVDDAHAVILLKITGIATCIAARCKAASCRTAEFLVAGEVANAGQQTAILSWLLMWLATMAIFGSCEHLTQIVWRSIEKESFKVNARLHDGFLS